MNVRMVIYVGYYLLTLLMLKDSLSFAITLPMMALVLYNVRKIRDPNVTLSDMIHFIMYLFFVIEPIQMIDHGRIGVGGTVSAALYSNAQMTVAMLIAFLFYATFTVVTTVFGESRQEIRAFAIGAGGTLPIAILSVIAFTTYVLLTGGIEVVLAPRYDRLLAHESQTSDSLGAISTVALGILTMAAALLCSQVRKRLDIALLCFLISSIFLIICFNPFNSSRFGLLSAYVPLGLIWLNGKVRAASFYGVAMFAILVIFPILNISTRFGTAGLSQGNLDIFSDALSLKFIDTYDMLVECVRYVGLHGYDHGTKILADLLIYYPRAWWPDKPLLGGLDLGNGLLNERIYGTANVSQIIAADGYMDFGLAGVILIGLVVAIIFNILVFKRRVLVNGHDLFAYALMASLPILARGPLGAVITVFLFQALTLMAARRLLGRKISVDDTVRPQGLGVAVVHSNRDLHRNRPRRAARAAIL